MTPAPDLPGMDPAFVADTVAALPSRLAKRLATADPSSWDVTGLVVRVGKATVTLDPPRRGSCDCLLSPKCLHLAQVLMACPVEGGGPAVSRSTPDPGSPSPEEPPGREAGAPSGERSGERSERLGEGLVEASDDESAPVLAEAAEAALTMAQDVLDVVLSKGLTGLAAVDRVAVLRVVAAARVSGLPRLAVTFGTLHGRLGGTAVSGIGGTAVSGTGGAGLSGTGGTAVSVTGGTAVSVTGGTAITGTAVTAAAVQALGECALAVHRLAHGQVTGTLDIEDIGIARRRYHAVGTLRLTGLASEPVLTDSGYAGVVTHLADADGKVWTLPSVLPGDAAVVAGAYRGSVGLPEMTATHAEVARAGLLVTSATASVDGRLGRGSGVRASLRQSSDAAVADPVEAGTRGWWCGEVTIMGARRGEGRPMLVLESPDGLVTCGFSAPAWSVAPESVRFIAGSRGERALVRLRPREPQDGHAAAWTLLGVRCEAWTDIGWVFPSLDRLTRSDVGADVSDELHDAPAAGIEPGTIIRRWRDAVARQGRRGVTGTQRPLLERDRRWLAAHASPHRAELLAGLAEAGAAGTRAFDGSFVPDPAALRPAWTALVVAS